MRIFTYIKLEKEWKKNKLIFLKGNFKLLLLFYLCQDDYDTYEDALAAVKKMKAFGIVLFPANFSVYMVERLVEQTSMSNKALEGSTVQVTFDMTGISYIVLKKIFVVNSFLQ